MIVKENIAWVFYISENASFDYDKVGKWMYFFKSSDDIEHINELCSNAVEQDIIAEAKHTNPDSFGLNPHGSADSGVCCFYLNCDDIERHKKILTYFLENNMIQRTKKGKLYNISFKLDNQTRAGEYGKAFKSSIKLSNFINLDTEEWIL